jgi:hypothetical protein
VIFGSAPIRTRPTDPAEALRVLYGAAVVSYKRWTGRREGRFGTDDLAAHFFRAWGEDDLTHQALHAARQKRIRTAHRHNPAPSTPLTQEA